MFKNSSRIQYRKAKTPPLSFLRDYLTVIVSRLGKKCYWSLPKNPCSRVLKGHMITSLLFYGISRISKNSELKLWTSFPYKNSRVPKLTAIAISSNRVRSRASCVLHGWRFPRLAESTLPVIAPAGQDAAAAVVSGQPPAWLTAACFVTSNCVK